MSYLLIVESSGKIKKITEYLGSDYIVTASFGHIMDLPKKDYINMETFEPVYIHLEDKEETIEKINKLINKIGKTNVLLASDEDREGEMIAWSLATEFDIKNAKRIVFNSITKKELEKAVSQPKKIDMNMVKAQQARRILDRLAGFIISPILKNTIGAPSAGRVQSVVVKIVLDREKEIEKFYSNKSETFFTINTDIVMDEYEFNTKLYNKTDTVEFDKLENFEESDESDELIDTKNKKGKSKNSPSKSCIIFPKTDETQVVEIIKNMTKAEYKLLTMNEKIRKSSPPPPFTTSTLQQYASQRLNMDGKRTMKVAQELYVNGYITYMRTDSTSISEEAMKSIKDEIESKYGIEYYEKKEFKNKKANTQEAHECIRPTKIHCDSNAIEGSTDEKKLYSIIWKRTIQSQMKPAEYQNITIEIEMLKRKLLTSYKLIGNLESLIFIGYLIVDGKKPSSPLSIDSIKKLLITWKNINGNEDTQKPPVRFNDASLINKMDPKNLNIGRPSTYATIIDKIITSGYVEIKDIDGKNVELNRYNVNIKEPKNLIMETKNIKIGKEKKKMVPTELGRKSTDFLENNFAKLMDYNFTAKMETQLDEIAEGNINKIDVLKPFYEYLQEQIKKIPNTKITNNFKQPEKIGVFDKYDVVLHSGKFGDYVVCNNLKFNVKMLFNIKTVMNDLDAELAELDKSDTENEDDIENIITNETILQKVIEKMETQKDAKSWKIGKKKYILKKGQYGFYIEEWNITTNKKINNYSIKFLIDKISKNNDLNINTDEDLIINKITNKDIEDIVEYFTNKSKSTTISSPKKKFTKK
jgi:DNA topoisomerase-1